MYNADLFELIDGHICRNEMSELIALLKKSSQLKYLCSEDGTSLLSRAAYYGNVEATQWLLEQGVDLWSENKYGQTALHIAFIVREGATAALLYHYERQIQDNPMAEKNLKLYHELFLSLRPYETEAEEENKKREKIELFHLIFDKPLTLRFFGQCSKIIFQDQGIGLYFFN